MSVHSGETTKDGKKWYFTCYYKDYKGITKQYKSKKYLTRKEAEKNELLFKTKNEVTCKDLYNKFYRTVNKITNILNDKENKVHFYLDKEFTEKDALIGVHPNENTATLWLKTSDLINIIEENGNQVNIIEI